MSRNKYPQIRDRITEVIYKEKKTRSSRWITWFIKRYLYYAFRALVNGYPININQVVRIALVHEKPRDYKKYDELRYVQNDGLYGYMFSVVFEFKKNNPQCSFYPDIRLKNLLQESVGSNNVYELIKQPTGIRWRTYNL